jgi:hypothetical protein
MRKLVLLLSVLAVALAAVPAAFALANGGFANLYSKACVPPPTSECCLKFISVTTSDNESTFYEPKEVGQTTASIINSGKTLSVTVNNAYPLYAGKVNFCVKNCGNLPVNITTIDIHNPNPDFVHLTLTGQVTGGITVPAGGSKCGQLVIDGTPQIPQSQNRTFTFTIDINYQCITSTCETAYAYGGCYAKCFLSIPGLQNNNWGWTNGPLNNGTYTWYLYAGAGQCDLSRGTKVGKVTVSYYFGKATVTYSMNPGYTLSATHLYVGSTILPKKNGVYTVSPGQYPYKHEGLNNVSSDSYTVKNLCGKIYIIAHAEVCWVH